ncbi:hypothetical protein BOTCAL_0004g00500 [Botryotinia calthae]|uniref:Uncharacterized protein n=1 Tax=Botryotinia calthae TaxID=38488 RepID=A0A4Y8DHC6_9HELO|nr:hypothetical protein BOTCAL_0004g00500 [Botryotinia calthae]
MSNPKPPPAPVILPIASDKPNLPSAPIGRKRSSIFFHQPISKCGSSSSSSSSSTNRDNDTNFHAFIEHGILLGLSGLPHTSNKRQKQQAQLLEVKEIPEFCLPEPAKARSVEGSGAFNTSTKRKAGESIAKDTDSGYPAGSNGGETFGSMTMKRRASDAFKMALCAAEESKIVSFGETSVIPTRGLEELKLDDDSVNVDGSKAGERK